MQGLTLLQKHGVEFNVLACVGRDTAHHPLEVYRFFKEVGVNFIQFSPIVERLPDHPNGAAGAVAASPGGAGRGEPNTR